MSSNNLSKGLFSTAEADSKEQATQSYMAIRQGARDEANELIPLKAAPTIDTARCTGCGRCISACPKKLFSLETIGYRKQAFIKDIGQCNLCGACIKVCPVSALTSETDKKQD